MRHPDITDLPTFAELLRQSESIKAESKRIIDEIALMAGQMSELDKQIVRYYRLSQRGEAP